jgi:hypothetical protein
LRDEGWPLLPRRRRRILGTWTPAAAGGSASPGRSHALADLQLLAPLDPGARIFGVGMNDATHLDDSGTVMPVPEQFDYEIEQV